MNHVAVKSVGCYSCLLCCVRCRWVWSFCAGYLLTFLLSLGLSCWWCCAACVRSGSSSWYPRWGRWCGRFSKDSRRFFWLAPVCIFHLCVAECVIYLFLIYQITRQIDSFIYSSSRLLFFINEGNKIKTFSWISINITQSSLTGLTIFAGELFK